MKQNAVVLVILAWSIAALHGCLDGSVIAFTEMVCLFAPRYCPPSRRAAGSCRWIEAPGRVPGRPRQDSGGTKGCGNQGGSEVKSCCPCTVLKSSEGIAKIAVSAVIEVESKRFDFFYLVEIYPIPHLLSPLFDSVVRIERCHALGSFPPCKIAVNFLCSVLSCLQLAYFLCCAT